MNTDEPVRTYIETRWTCGKCGRNDSVNQPYGSDMTVCLACGHEEPALVAAHNPRPKEKP